MAGGCLVRLFHEGGPGAGAAGLGVGIGAEVGVGVGVAAAGVAGGITGGAPCACVGLAATAAAISSAINSIGTASATPYPFMFLRLLTNTLIVLTEFLHSVYRPLYEAAGGIMSNRIAPCLSAI